MVGLFPIAVDQGAMEGPISDDRPWNSAVAANAQKIGRYIRCCGRGDRAPNIPQRTSHKNWLRMRDLE
jgi:hypothetical protein